MAHAEQIVDNLESLVSGGEVNSGNVGNLCIFRRGVVYQDVSLVADFFERY
jgi:hypothetical protein